MAAVIVTSALVVPASDRSPHDFVLTRDQPASVRSGAEVFESNVARQSAEQRNAAAEQHRNARNSHPLDQSGLEKTLNGFSPVDVGVSKAALIQLRDDLLRLSFHELQHRVFRMRLLVRSSTKNNDRLLFIGPSTESEYGFECVATYHVHIDALDERCVAVLLSAARW